MSSSQLNSQSGGSSTGQSGAHTSLTGPTDSGPVPTSAAMHHAKACGHAVAACKDNEQIAQALKAGDYSSAASKTIDMVEHRGLQVGEEVAAGVRAVVGGSSVKTGDSTDPSFLKSGSTSQ